MNGSDKQITSYEILGWIGIISALLVGILLAPLFQLHWSTIVWMFVIGLLTTYIFNVVQLFFRKEPEHTLYHYFFILLASNGLVSIITGMPYAIIMDSFLISFSIIAGFGRIGCYSVGCCYGKRTEKGRFPTQFTEATFHIINASLGIAICLYFALPQGDIALLLTFNYAFLRFLLEYFRGDLRPYFLGLSEAQWTSLALVFTVCILFWTRDQASRSTKFKNHEKNEIIIKNDQNAMVLKTFVLNNPIENTCE